MNKECTASQAQAQPRNNKKEGLPSPRAAGSYSSRESTHAYCKLTQSQGSKGQRGGDNADTLDGEQGAGPLLVLGGLFRYREFPLSRLYLRWPAKRSVT